VEITSKSGTPMRVLLVDNFDSFTYNLYQHLSKVCGEVPRCVVNTVSWEEVEKELETIDAVVLGPGPGHPGKAVDIGVSDAILRNFMGPVLGVCLGHQALCHIHGGRVSHAEEPIHGRKSAIIHNEAGGSEHPLFRGIPSPFKAIRYNSLLAEYPLPDCLEELAYTISSSGTRENMALRHRDRPHYGVQFHPESICTDYGKTLLSNFLDMAKTLGTPRAVSVKPSRFLGPKQMVLPKACVGANPSKPLATALPSAPRSPPGYREFRDLPWVEPELVFEEVVRPQGAEWQFWLDSAKEIARLGTKSFMGDASGPLTKTIEFSLATGVLREQEAGGELSETQFEGNIFDYVDKEVERWTRDGATTSSPGFDCGHVGYFSYESRQHSGIGVHKVEHLNPEGVPDVALLRTDRVIAFDHKNRSVSVRWLTNAEVDAVQLAWAESVKERIQALHDSGRRASDEVPSAPRGMPTFHLRDDEHVYARNIDECQKAINDGESYELCLTTQLRCEAPPSFDTYELYRRLRRINPAPFAAYLKFGPDLEVLSCSPERFVRMDPAGLVECRPIKGTRKRVQDPKADAAIRADLASNEKDFAENIMIVDLMRNDLGRICLPGSVKVPQLCKVETYATVHQLVSQIIGTKPKDVSCVSAFKAIFPAGSMTGAPKIRSMEIIESLEQGPRGVYSGCIGYFGTSGGSDFNVVIRTAVVRPNRDITIGAGGAIIALSNVDEEIEEMLLKASAQLKGCRGICSVY